MVCEKIKICGGGVPKKSMWGWSAKKLKYVGVGNKFFHSALLRISNGIALRSFNVDEVQDQDQHSLYHCTQEASRRE